MGDVGDVRDTLGATLIGAFLSAGLSGMLTLQIIFYFRIYAVDFSRNRIMVAILWVLDVVHISMACSATWTYLVTNRSDNAISDYIPWTIAVTVALTAIITFIVHCFFAHRVYSLSGKKLLLASPIVILAFGRLFAALVSTSQMIRLKSFEKFVDQYGWVFTVGLSLSVAVDVIITVSLLIILRRSRTGYGTTTDRIIDIIAVYTVETGMITAVTTVVSLICWVTMPHNLIFLALHFTISKLYANSALATLNTRRALRARTQQSGELPTIRSENINTYPANSIPLHAKHLAPPAVYDMDNATSEEDGLEQICPNGVNNKFLDIFL
ncbi:hypothetical protein EUX98_g5518 [Antrodiella citrinella]|uniref:DUF6534 domain-containing protein n=1 Tax=Antrodiella citrinella TaxID=2447956 RepID=A0A4V3XIC3_9APHY|nr:hypothetical protein EUX98_g5518 [Antrodiella citrinella]